MIFDEKNNDEYTYVTLMDLVSFVLVFERCTRIKGSNKQ